MYYVYRDCLCILTIFSDLCYKPTVSVLFDKLTCLLVELVSLVYYECTAIHWLYPICRISQVSYTRLPEFVVRMRVIVYRRQTYMYNTPCQQCWRLCLMPLAIAVTDKTTLCANNDETP